MSTRVPQERRRRRPTRSGVLLSENLIVETALRLIGEHGPEALSVRRLGAALGCDPTAPYRYFHDTDDLVLAIADRIIGDAMAGFVPGDDWVASLREMALRVRAGYVAHPRAAAMAAHRVTRRTSEIQAVDTGYQVPDRPVGEPYNTLTAPASWTAPLSSTTSDGPDLSLNTRVQNWPPLATSRTRHPPQPAPAHQGCPGSSTAGMCHVQAARRAVHHPNHAPALGTAPPTSSPADPQGEIAEPVTVKVASGKHAPEITVRVDAKRRTKMGRNQPLRTRPSQPLRRAVDHIHAVGRFLRFVRLPHGQVGESVPR